MLTNSEIFPDLFETALAELHAEGKISIKDDIVHAISPADLQPPTPPPKPPKTPPKTPPNLKDIKKELENLDPNEKIPPQLLKVLFEETNAYALGRFMGFTPDTIKGILHNKTTFTVQDTGDALARVAIINDHKGELQVSTKQFKTFINYYTSPNKPVEYWLMIHVFIHELIHLFSWAEITPEAIIIEESLTPLVEHEFIFANAGGFSPHLIDLDESSVMRYYHKTASEPRLQYPPEVFYVYDQLLGFSTVYPTQFKTLFRTYYTSTSPIETRISKIESYSASLNYPIKINAPSLSQS